MIVYTKRIIHSRVGAGETPMSWVGEVSVSSGVVSANITYAPGQSRSCGFDNVLDAIRYTKEQAQTKLSYFAGRDDWEVLSCEEEEKEQDKEAPCCKKDNSTGGVYHVLLCYTYVHIQNIQPLVEELTDLCGPNKLNMTGRILIATEGINMNLGSTSFSRMEELQRCLQQHKVLGQHKIDFKMDTTQTQPFPDLAIKVVPEIVSTGNTIPLELLTNEKMGGEHLSPEQFHQVLHTYNTTQQEKDLVLLDVRNRKEIAFGSFVNSVNPDTKMFSQWPQYAKENAPNLKDKKVLMYCTGGVRCEKASAYLKKLGVSDVSQLSGGIHRYLEKYNSNGYFKGSNFVFDSRGLQKPKGAEIVSECFSCHEKEEGLSSDRVCAVCRDTVIVCDKCRIRRACVFFCTDHANLENIYYPFLETFSLQELMSQRSNLEQLLAAEYAAPEKKTRRRAIRKQLQRVNEQINHKQTRNDQLEQRLEKKFRCRSCGHQVAELLQLTGAVLLKEEVYCNGDCWGFFQTKRKAEGYYSLGAS